MSKRLPTGQHDALFLALRGWITAELTLDQHPSRATYQTAADRCHLLIRRLLETTSE